MPEGGQKYKRGEQVFEVIMGKILKINDRNQSTDPRSSRQNKQGKQLSLYVLSVIYLSNFYLLPIYLNYAYAYHI